MTRSVFEKIMKGEADAFALGARGHMTEIRPINFEFPNPNRIAELMEIVKPMATFFFTPGRIKIKRLHSTLAGEAHGAHPLPLVYWQGLRSAIYYLKPDEVLNEAGEKDPWPQLFIVRNGSGKVTIDNEEFELVPDTVIFIPRNVLHQVKAQSPTELIWIAWDAN
jgi:mannose-6-phosphate isomerase-like protein (cupin superfamily)